jgi:hypothetical protein
MLMKAAAYSRIIVGLGAAARSQKGLTLMQGPRIFGRVLREHSYQPLTSGSISIMRIKMSLKESRCVLRFQSVIWFFLLASLSAAAIVLAQTQQKKPEPQGGVSTGTPVNYSSRRTAGITDPKAAVVFEEVTDKTALANFKHRSGSPQKNYIFETVSGGVAIFDYDGDGLPDVYLVNGSTTAALQGKEKPPRAALYRNLGSWKFEDVTDKAGVGNDRWGCGVAVADYDNDGHPDMYVTNFGVSRLYHNNGNGTFTDVAEKLGVARKGWSTGASFGDYDGDGRLDLFVPGYADIDLNNLPPSPSEAGKPGGVGQNFCQFRGVVVMC